MKYKRAANEAQHNLDHQQPHRSEQREAVQLVQQEENEAMEMKSNDACISTTQQIPTEDSVAYGQATPQIQMVDNVAYGQIESNCDLLSDYEYV